MELVGLRGVTGSPDNFPNSTISWVFSKIKLKRLPYKTTYGKSSGKPMSPLYLKSSPDNFPIQQLAGLFSKIKLKRLPYKTTNGEVI